MISLLFLGALSLAILYGARRAHFFSFEDQKEKWFCGLAWFHVLFAFLLYFAVAILIVPLLAHLLKAIFPFQGNLVAFASWINLLSSLTILLFLSFFLLFLPKGTASSVLHKEGPVSLQKDIRMALLAWVISFPLVLFFSSLLEWLLALLFQTEKLPEQLAVYFLRMTFDNPLYLLLALFTIIFLAPLIEETLFRGFLQSYIRKQLGSKQAIGITSLCFSFFHYSPEQGLGNIPIIGSLFILALFLGILYEKRASLFAPMMLHALFNAISVINLYFLGDLFL